MCPQLMRKPQGRRQPPAGATIESSPGLVMKEVWSGWRGQMIGKPVPIWPLSSISSRMVDQVAFLRRFAAFPKMKRPCFALERATLMRFEL